MYSRGRASRGLGKLTPTRQLRAKYSLGFIGRDLVGGELQLADPARLLHHVVEEVELAERLGDPRAALLGEHEAQTGEPVERAAREHVRQRALREERGLGEPDDTAGRLGAVVGRAGAGVLVDDDVEVLADRPQLVVASSSRAGR